TAFRPAAMIPPAYWTRCAAPAMWTKPICGWRRGFWHSRIGSRWRAERRWRTIARRSCSTCCTTAATLAADGEIALRLLEQAARRCYNGDTSGSTAPRYDFAAGRGSVQITPSRGALLGDEGARAGRGARRVLFSTDRQHLLGSGARSCESEGTDDGGHHPG